jgi:cytochrome c-type biogenesis protein CcmH
VQGAADAALSEPISSGETDAGDAGGDDCLLRRTHHLHVLRAESGRRSAFRIREGRGHRLDLSFTARIGTLMVGSIRLTPICIGETPALLLGPLTVEPPFRSRGVGSKLIERALKLDPDNVKALALAGAAAFDRRDGAEAALLWDRVALLGPPGSPVVEQAREGAAEARKMVAERASSASTPAGNAAPSPAGPAAGPGPRAAGPGGSAGTMPGMPSSPTAAVAGPTVRGTVTLSAALKAQARPEDAVFIFARNAEGGPGGGRMPLAILRLQVKDLPAPFTLDDSLAMGPGMGLSSAQKVIVGARISRSGQAMPQPGDVEGLSAPVAVGSQGVVVDISRVLP